MRTFAIVVSLLALAALPAAAQFPINTTFMDSNSTGWDLSSFAGSNFTPCLTSGNPACGNDPVGQGWLRLTDNVAQSNGEAGYAYFNTAFPVNQGFAIDFEYVAWGGTGADGIGVILFDGATPTFSVGAPGGSFGYAADYNAATGCSFTTPNDTGLSGAYLGIGLDEFGNFQNPGDRCKNGGPGAIPDSISLRGPGGGGDNSGANYLYLGGTGTLTPGVDSPGGAARPANITYYRHVVISVVPNTTVNPNTVNVTVSWMTSLYGSFTTVLQGTYTLPNGYVTPSTLKLGFTASTGGSTNYHEIRNVKVSYPADLAVTKTHSGTPGSGGTTAYTMTVTNNGPVNVVGATLTDPLPTGVTLTATPTCAVTGTGTCSVTSGTASPINVTVNLNNGAVATVTAPVQLPVGTPQQLINTATITPPADITDTNPNNNSATDTISFGTIPNNLVIAKTASSLQLRGNAPDEYFTLVVTNPGPYTYTGVTVSDVLNSTLFDSVGAVTTTQGTCTTAMAVSCSLGTMQPNSTATITIQATPNAPNRTATYPNAATATCSESPTQAISNTVNISVVRNSTPTSTNLAITKTHYSTPAAGSTVTYTIVVTNTGTSITGANYAAFNDTLPPSFDDSKPVTWTCAVSTGTGSCPATLPSGRAASMQLQLNSGATITITAAGTLLQTGLAPIVTNSATITPPATWADSNGANNTATDQFSASVPVTLARFLATSEPGGVRFQWTSAIEAANAGFNLYAETGHGLERLNERLIPSSGDSTVPVHYERFIEGAPSGPYLLEEVDLLGGVRRHGPFQADQPYGAEPAPRPIDWVAVRRSALRARAAGAVPATRVKEVELLVDHDGLFRVTYESLAAAGFDLGGIPVQNLALSCRGVAVPLLVVGPGTLTGDAPQRPFGPGVAVEFIGHAVDSLYTHTNVYTLAKKSRGARIALDATPVPAGQPAPYYMETATVTRPLAYSFASPTGSPWYETALLAYTTPVSRTFTVPVDNLAAGAGGARFSFHMWGGTDWPAAPDHHAVLALDGQTVADERFDGIADHPVSGAVPDGTLAEGANTFTLTLPGDTGVDYEIVDVTSYGLTYPRRFVARNGALRFTSDGSVLAVDGLPSSNVEVYRLDGPAPTRLTQVQTVPDASGVAARFAGAGTTASYLVCDASTAATPEYAAVPNATSITNGYADYLIIAHPDFIAGLDPLVQARSAQGLRVKVADVDDVYAAFGGGIVDPQAIHDYIAYAYRNMKTRYVLLVGGDTYDTFNYLGTGSVSFIPTPYAPTGDLIRFAPADPLLADVDGDGVPDLALGRLPVRTPAELATVIAKTLAYPGQPSNTNAVFAADTADAGYSFEGVSDQLAALLPPPWSVTRAYIDELGLTGARAALIGAINGGAAFTSFVGHSGFTEWSFADLFTDADAEALLNAGHPTVVAQWGCWNTYYVEPHDQTLAETLLLAGPQGAAAVLGPATLSEADSEAALAQRLLPLLFTSRLPLGVALTQAKQQLAASKPGAIDVLRGWTLLGDPALVVAPAPAGMIAAPGGGVE